MDGSDDELGGGIGSCCVGTAIGRPSCTELMPGTPALLSAAANACAAAVPLVPMAATAACRLERDAAVLVLGSATCRVAVTAALALYGVPFAQPLGGGDGGGGDGGDSCSSRRWRPEEGSTGGALYAAGVHPTDTFTSVTSASATPRYAPVPLSRPAA